MVADFEAGLGTLTRMEPGDVDVLLVVSEPSLKAMEVSRRAIELVGEKRLGRTVLIANRVRPEDRGRFEAAFAGHEPLFVPDDPGLRSADARGRAPFDDSPDGPAVRALRALASSLLQSP